MTKQFHVTDNFGRSYFEGQTFVDRATALSAARKISEDDRPHGVWIVADDEEPGEEIFQAAA